MVAPSAPGGELPAGITRSTLSGAWRFALTGVGAFAVWAFAEELSGLSREAAAILGKLSWGLLYGLGFGAGLGYTFRVCRPRIVPEGEPAA